jgi:aminoglycoside phosphotransferase family enzyme/adenylate kinase family enzyme
MIVDAQTDTIAFLSDPAHYTHASSVERIDTHTAAVFLAGERAYKLKRAVRYDYLDYSTIERRRALCEAEVNLNRRTAPGLYLGTVPLTRTADGQLQIGGSGTPVDWLVMMERFPQEQMLDRLAESNRLSLETVVRLADHIAVFHGGATVRRDAGGSDAIELVIGGNSRALVEAGAVLNQGLVTALDKSSREWLSTCRPLLDGRRARGMVRQCHGDLHLRNIVMIGGAPTLFDAIEFNDDFACIDVMYDLAFLLMDLLARELTAHASAVFNRYLLRTVDFEGLAVLPLFLSCRAAIRAKTSLAAAAMSTDRSRVTELHHRARRYLELANRLVQRAPARVVAIGGYSGTGKSTVARRLAPQLGIAPGAVVLRTDEIRRQLFAAGAESAMPERAYTPASRRAAYAGVRRQARRVLEAGYSVIADGVFGEVAERRAIESLAQTLEVPFVGLWLEADLAILEQRIAARRGDASDATRDVLHRQLRMPLRQLRWPSIYAGGTPADTERLALGALADGDQAFEHARSGDAKAVSRRGDR